MNRTDVPSRPALGAFVLLAAGMILFGSATPVSKIVTGAMPVFIGSLLRVGLGALALAPFALPRLGELKTVSRGDIAAMAAIALFGMVGFSAFMLYGMRMISGVGGAVVMAMTPAVTAAAAIVFFGERASRRKLIALALAVGGVLILHVSGAAGEEDGGANALLGIAMIFAAVCCEAAYTLLGRKVSADISPVLVAFVASAASIPLFAVAAAFQWSGFDALAVSAGEWAAVAWYGAGTLALGTALWYSGLSRTQGSTAAVFMGLMPVSALVLSYVLLGEAFRWVHLLGFGVVFASVLLISREHMGHD
ncbi:DMT family transporter [Hyphococcus luteus]|uniref:DMT family transporter n=1 Tax=Hyphococcus luteus TaxID=2058213 RepID=UPI0013FDA172|nr:DMT family transporter [Marinicaulis flavus]